MKKSLLTLLLVLSVFGLLNAEGYKVQSPGKTLQVDVEVGDAVTWSLYRDGKLVMGPSVISMTLEMEGVLGKNTRVRKVIHKSVNNIIKTPVYKKSEVVDHYNQMTLQLRDGLGLEFRAYNEGVAYRIVTAFKRDITVISEEADFVFPTPGNAWVPYIVSNLERYMTSFESTYNVLSLKDVDENRLIITPLLVEAGEGRKVVITEADLEDYAGMFVTINKKRNGFRGEFAPFPLAEKVGGHNNLQAIVTQRANYIAKTKGTRTFPWRVFADRKSVV